MLSTAQGQQANMPVPNSIPGNLAYVYERLVNTRRLLHNLDEVIHGARPTDLKPTKDAAAAAPPVSIEGWIEAILTASAEVEHLAHQAASNILP